MPGDGALQPRQHLSAQLVAIQHIPEANHVVFSKYSSVAHDIIADEVHLARIKAVQFYIIQRRISDSGSISIATTSSAPAAAQLQQRCHTHNQSL